jgi:hypothetical protein
MGFLLLQNASGGDSDADLRLPSQRALHVFLAVSRGEAEQEKALLVLETGSWKEVERIPLDLGPRHFSATAAGAEPPAALRPGDK